MNTVRLEGEMAKKGLTKEIIVNAALEQIEKNGLSAFSLRNLAASLGYRSHHCIIILKARVICWLRLAFVLSIC